MGRLSIGQVFFSFSQTLKQAAWYLWLHGVCIIDPFLAPPSSLKFYTKASVASGCRQMAQTSSIISSPSDNSISTRYLWSLP
jgi:hypothetical protein